MYSFLELSRTLNTTGLLMRHGLDTLLFGLSLLICCRFFPPNGYHYILNAIMNVFGIRWLYYVFVDLVLKIFQF